MEDIICPECGRPNLFEAKKCWYCQLDLQDIKRSEMENHPVESFDTNHSHDKEETSNSNDASEQSIPEWLKRVRELKAADQPPEEKDHGWEQQDLFKLDDEANQSKKLVDKKPAIKKENPHKEIKKEKKNDDPADLPEKKPYVFQRKEPTNDQEKLETESADQDDDTLSHNLPEGFIKL